MNPKFGRVRNAPVFASEPLTTEMSTGDRGSVVPHAREAFQKLPSALSKSLIFKAQQTLLTINPKPRFEWSNYDFSSSENTGDCWHTG